MPASSIDPANDPHGVSVGALAAALAQVPTSPARLQRIKGSVQAVSQQTLSAQERPDAHCEVVAHAPPWGTGVAVAVGVIVGVAVTVEVLVAVVVCVAVAVIVAVAVTVAVAVLVPVAVIVAVVVTVGVTVAVAVCVGVLLGTGTPSMTAQPKAASQFTEESACSPGHPRPPHVDEHAWTVLKHWGAPLGQRLELVMSVQRQHNAPAA